MILLCAAFLLSVLVTCHGNCQEEIVSNLAPIIEEMNKLKQEVGNLKLELAMQKREKPTGSVMNKLDREYSKSSNKLSSYSSDKRLRGNGEQSSLVAFYAYMSTNEPVQKHKTLVFDVEQLNFGRGYNNNTGVFTAPGSGLYVFTFTIHSGTSSYASLELVQNNAILGTIFSDSSDTVELNANTAVIPAWVNQGDVVYVRTHSTYGSTGNVRSDGIARTSFAAWKVSN